MDNVTHGLWGIGIYGAWVAAQPHVVHSPLSTSVFLAAVLSSEAPDADYVVKLVKGPPAYLKQHRAISHSLPAWFVWALIIAGALSLWHPGHFPLLFLISMIGVVVHTLLDVFTPYGTQALWPFTKRRFRLDILFTIDPVFIVLGALGLILTGRGDSDLRVIEWCFGISLVYIAIRTMYGMWLTRRLRRMYPDAIRCSVLPQMVPWWWAYVMERKDGVIGGPMGFRGPKREEMHWVRPEANSPNAAIATWAMKENDIGRLFVWFARHLIWSVKRDGAVERVFLADATYRFGQFLPFAVCVSVLKGEAGEWVVGSEIIRGQSVDFTSIIDDATHGDSGQKDSDGLTNTPESPKRLQPKMPPGQG